MSATRIFIVVGALLVLGAVNFSIAGKERIKRDGEVIYLDLAPVDPRSLMQGDYMTLRFRLATEIQGSLASPSAAGGAGGVVATGVSATRCGGPCPARRATTGRPRRRASPRATTRRRGTAQRGMRARSVPATAAHRTSPCTPLLV